MPALKVVAGPLARQSAASRSSDLRDRD